MRCLFTCFLLWAQYKADWNYLFQTKNLGKHLTTIECICSNTFQISTWTRKYCGCCKKKEKISKINTQTHTHTHTHTQESINITYAFIYSTRNVFKYAPSMKVSYWQNAESNQFFLSHKIVMLLVCSWVLSNHSRCHLLSFQFISLNFITNIIA